jgi:N-acetylmuramic acid 6-phosphate etherase
VALTVRATRATEEEARQVLESCGYRVKVAIVVIRGKRDVRAAEAALASANGSVRGALADV